MENDDLSAGHTAYPRAWGMHRLSSMVCPVRNPDAMPASRVEFSICTQWTVHWACMPRGERGITPLAEILPGDAEAHSAPLLYKHFQRITWILDEITMR